MDLPPELRVEVYRLALVKQGAEYERLKYTLRPPPLAQVCKQVRAEVLPVYYGENAFHIDMDIDVIGYEEDMYPFREDDDSQLNKFLDMCSTIVSTGCLQFITNLEVNYSEPVFEDMSNYLLGLEFTRDSDNSTPRGRIGDDNLDWDDSEAVTEAFNATLKRSAGYYDAELREHVPVANIIKVLFALATHCQRANHYVRLSWDYDH
jgi:hypothetical protein